ncbi:amino acid deaminase [Leucobacter iarius]|uniref:Amino acid deaminase n=1 Tax=Leucobacter iarius TaxID=333963 RepID=A0ABP4XPK4_9MICO
MTDAPFPLPELPPVLDAVRRDTATGRLAHWGASTLIDEHTGVPSIDAELFETLHRAAGLDAAFPIGHAGLLHVYGYWYSTVPTPFGYKRDRWHDGTLARAYGLPADAFHLDAPQPSPPGSGAPGSDPEPTLLARVTAAALPVLRRPPAGSLVADAVVDGRLSRVVLHRAPGAETPALVYGIEAGGSDAGGADGTGGTGSAAPPGSAPTSDRLVLLTTFPFSGDPAPLLEEFVREPVLRWNAVSHS